VVQWLAAAAAGVAEERRRGIQPTFARRRPMNSGDALYGRIKNGVLTLSGNNASIRVDGGALVVSDGPRPIAPDHYGPAPPIAERMVTHRFRRADCPINRIIVTRPDGFITFAAIKWCTASEWVSCSSIGTGRSF
jgi:hypothetical protein